MKRKYSVVCYCLTMIMFGGCILAQGSHAANNPGGKLPDPTNSTAVIAHMEKLLRKNMTDSEWPLDMDKDRILVVDWRLNRCYSKKDGLREMKLERVPSKPEKRGVYAGQDGFSLNSLISTDGKTYPVFRQIRSITGTTYSKVSAYITLGYTTGVDGRDVKSILCDEGAFNYFGLATSNGYDMECGLCTQHHMNHTEPEKCWDHAGKWYVYRAYSSPGSGGVNWKQFMADPARPLGGYPAGTEVYMKMWIGVDGALMALYCCSDPTIPAVGEINYTVNEDPPLTVPSASCTFRRTTSMVVGGRASSQSNAWRSTKIGTVGGTEYDWDASRSNSTVFHGSYASWVTPRDNVVRTDETITIRVPITDARKKQ